MPGVHSHAADRPVVLANVPATDGIVSATLAGQKYPTGHGVAADEPVGQNDPPGHDGIGSSCDTDGQ